MVVSRWVGGNQQPQWKRPAAGAYGPWQGKPLARSTVSAR